MSNTLNSSGLSGLSDLPGLSDLIVHNSDFGLLVIDRDERVVVWNRWLAVHSGIEENAALGQPLTALWPSLAHTRVRRAIEEGLVTDEYNQVYRKEFHSPNGSYVNFLFWLTLFQHFPKEVCELLADERLVRVLNQKKYDRLWGRVYKWGENARKAQRLSMLAVRGKLLEVATMRDLKRAANQMK